MPRFHVAQMLPNSSERQVDLRHFQQILADRVSYLMTAECPTVYVVRAELVGTLATSFRPDRFLSMSPAPCTAADHKPLRSVTAP